MVKRAVLTGFVLLFVFVGGKAFGDAAGDLKQADGYYANREYSKARGSYQSIVAAHPGTDYALKAQAGIAKVNIAVNKPSEADAAISKLIADYAENPILPITVYYIASTYQEFKNGKKAHELFTYVFEHWPGSDGAMKVQRNTALKYLHLNQKEKADEAISKLLNDYAEIAILPKSILTVANRCRENRPNKAIELFQYICDTWPGTFHALRAQTELINSYIAADDDKNAETVIRKLSNDFSIHPDLPEVVRIIANVYCDKGEYHKAMGLYQYFCETSPELRGKFTDSGELVRALCDIADRYLKNKKDYDNANKLNEYIVSNFPKSTYALRAQKNLIKSYIKTKDEANADKAVRKLANDFINFPGQWNAIRRVVDMYRDQGRHDKAVGLCQYLIETYPNDTDRINWRKMVAILHINMNEDDKVTKMLGQIIIDFNDSPQLPKAVFQIGEEYYEKALKKGNTGANNCFSKALMVWAKIIEGMPASAERRAIVYFYSAVCYEKLGDYARAGEHYEKVSETCPSYGFAWNAQFMVARCYEKLQETGGISKAAAQKKIKAAYEQLLAKYPDCKAAGVASRWLSK